MPPTNENLSTSSADRTGQEDGEHVFHPTSEGYHLKYEEELSQLYRWTESGIEGIANLAVNGNLEKSRFRSVIWQILLGVLPHQSCLWVQKLRKSRNYYRTRRDHLLVDPQAAPDNDHPLSQISSSAWHQYFCDKELRSVIRRDVVRTSPGDSFFSSESIQSTMVNILFLYAREHHDICYRQGMHEVLAPLILVLHADHQALVEAQKVTSIQGPILEVLDHTCLEEDAYCLLDTIMKHLACTYCTPDVTPSSTGVFPSQNMKPVEIESEVFSRMRRIRDELLDAWEPELRQHFINLEIPLLFGIRWLRVIFGQEFSKDNLLILWDAIFGADNKLGLINYIVVAMLIVIKNRLLEEDLTGCLNLLIHYPAELEVHNIRRYALFMYNSKEYPLPDGFLGQAKPMMKAESSSISGRFRQFVSRSRKTESVLSPSNTTSRSSSFRIRGHRSEHGDNNFNNFVENFSRPRQIDSNQDCFELLTSLQSKVFLTSLRLTKYQATVEQHLSGSAVPTSVMNALEGMKEIAELLAAMGPPQIEVETAVEATPSPNVSAPSSPELAFNPANPTPTPTPTPTPARAPVNANKPISFELIGKIVELTEKDGFNTKFVLSNPLQCQYDLEEPERNTSIHSCYRRTLGEKKIFARIKQ